MSWISVEDGYPPGVGAIVNVKRRNDKACKAYYFKDRMSWVNFYGISTSRFQDCETLIFYQDVTHWMPLLEAPNESDPYGNPVQLKQSGEEK